MRVDFSIWMYISLHDIPSTTHQSHEFILRLLQHHITNGVSSLSSFATPRLRVFSQQTLEFQPLIRWLMGRSICYLKSSADNFLTFIAGKDVYKGRLQASHTLQRLR